MREPACGCKACACGTATKLHLAWSTAAAAVNMMTVGASRMRKGCKTQYEYHPRRTQAMRRIRDVVGIIPCSHDGDASSMMLESMTC